MIFDGTSFQNNIFFQTFRLSVTINDSMILAVLAFSTVATLRKLSADQEFMSAKVRYMQAQLNRLMFAEERQFHL